MKINFPLLALFAIRAAATLCMPLLPEEIQVRILLHAFQFQQTRMVCHFWNDLVGFPGICKWLPIDVVYREYEVEVLTSESHLDQLLTEASEQLLISLFQTTWHSPIIPDPHRLRICTALFHHRRFADDFDLSFGDMANGAREPRNPRIAGIPPGILGLSRPLRAFYNTVFSNLTVARLHNFAHWQVYLELAESIVAAIDAALGPTFLLRCRLEFEVYVWVHDPLLNWIKSSRHGKVRRHAPELIHFYQESLLSFYGDVHLAFGLLEHQVLEVPDSGKRKAAFRLWLTETLGRYLRGTSFLQAHHVALFERSLENCSDAVADELRSAFMASKLYKYLQDLGYGYNH